MNFVGLCKRFLIVAFLCAISSLSFSINRVKAQEPTQKIVYVVICVDSEMWGGHDPYIGSSNPHPTMDMRAYARSPPSTVSQVFDNGFRNSHRDSFGNMFKITWFAEMDYLMAQGNFVYADGSPAGVSGYTAIRDILVNNWGTEIQTYGDSMEYHHHLMIYDETWQIYGNDFDAGYPDYPMYALDHMIIDRNSYPSTFRSGWFLMPPALSNWLEQRIPFDYTPESGIWYPVHPSGMSRWQTRAVFGVSQSDVNASFARALSSGNAIYSFFCHDRDDIASKIDSLQGYLNTANADEATYPDVSFKYVSAREAMQRALGFTDFTPPTFTVTSSGGTYTITSNEPVWQNQPYVALKYTDGRYMHPAATAAGTNMWTITPPIQIATEENVAVRARATKELPTGVTASSYYDGHTPDLAIDGIASTSNYWGTNAEVPEGQVPQWLKLDLRSPVKISKIITHFYDGDSRTYTYYIEVSIDGSVWTTVVPARTGRGSVINTFPEVETRFVRITITANTANQAAHIEEIRIYNVTTTPLPPLEKIGIAASDIYGNTGVLVKEAQRYYLTITSTIGGTTNPPPGNYTYDKGTNLTVTAYPSANYTFSHWVFDEANITQNPIQLTVNTSHKLNAIFKQIPPPPPQNWTIMILSSPSTGGTTAPNGSNSVPYNLPLTAVASPMGGYAFKHWVFDGFNATNSTTIIIPPQPSGSNHTLVALFEVIPPPSSPKGKDVFVINTNSTLSELNFNSKDGVLSFKVSGPSGTKGYVNASLARTILPNADQLKVYLDGLEINYTMTLTQDYCYVYFEYNHSEHYIKIMLLQLQSKTPTEQPIALTLIAVSVVLFSLLRKNIRKLPSISKKVKEKFPRIPIKSRTMWSSQAWYSPQYSSESHICCGTDAHNENLNFQATLSNRTGCSAGIVLVTKRNSCSNRQRSLG